MKNLKIYKIILGLSIPLLLQSCFVAKNYERPEVETENVPQAPRTPTVIGAKCAVCTKTILMQMDGSVCECGAVFHNEYADGGICPICNTGCG